MTEKVVSKVAKGYYIQRNIGGVGDIFRAIPVEDLSKWEIYVAYCNEIGRSTWRTVWVYVDVTTMTGRSDEEEYQIYEELFRD